MPKVFKVKRGDKIRLVSESEIESLANLGWKEVGTKRITTETGERTVGSAEARKRISQGKASGFADEGVREASRIEAGEQRRHGTTLEKIQTFGESGLNALTFGLADGVIEDLNEAGGYEGDVARRQRVNPGTALAGSVTGTLAGALAGPGSLARFTPAGLAARVAGKAGAKVAASTGSRVAGFAAEGVVDGALFGGGQAYANAVINDQPVNAEKIIAQMGSEALYGGAFGGALGGAVGGLGKLSRRIDAKKLAKAKTAASKTDEFTSLATGRVLDVMEDSAKLSGASISDVRESVGKLGTADNAVAGSMLDDVTDFVRQGGDVPSPSAQHFDELAKKHPLINKPRGDEELERVLTDVFGENVGKINESNEFFAKLHASKRTEAVGETLAKEAGKKGGLVQRVKDLAIPAAMGAVGGPTGAVLGVMARGVKGGSKKIGDGVEKFVKFAGKHRRGTVPAATTILGKIRFDKDVGKQPEGNRKDQFKARAAELKSLAQNPEKVNQRIQENLKTMKVIKPGLSDALTAVALKRINFLNSVLPQGANKSTFGPDRWKPSQTEIDKFARIAAAAEDPYSILDDMNSGKLTQESVDTVKQLYPEIYREMQMGIIERVDDIKKNVDYKGRIQLGIMFGVPTDDVLQPAFIQRMQENYARRAQEQEQGGSGGQFSTPGAQQKSISNNQTSSQRVESK